MRLEQTIQYMYDNYAILFQERRHALNQLFCVIGNGYEWVDGELVDIDCQPKKADYVPILDANGKAVFNQAQMDITIQEEFDRLKAEEEATRQQFRDAGVKGETILDFYPINEDRLMKRAKRMAGYFCADSFSFYPLSPGYSALFTLPEDIKPDWLEGAKETVALLLEHGYGYSGELNDYQKEQYASSEKLLAELAKRFDMK